MQFTFFIKFFPFVSFRFKDYFLIDGSRLLPTADASARGFIGLAFRIKKDNSSFESIYIRPTN